MNAVVETPAYSIQDVLTKLPAPPPVVRTATRGTGVLPGQRRSPEDTGDRPGDQLNDQVRPDDFLVATVSAEVSGANITFPRDDGSTSRDKHAQVYEADDADGCARVTVYGAKYAADFGLEATTGSYKTFDLLAHIFCDGDYTLAARVVRAHLHNLEGLMAELANRPTAEELRDSVAGPATAVRELNSPADETDKAFADITGTPVPPARSKGTPTATHTRVADPTISRDLCHLRKTPFGMVERFQAYNDGIFKFHPDRDELLTYNGVIWVKAEGREIRQAIMAVIRATQEYEADHLSSGDGDKMPDKRAELKSWAAGFETIAMVRGLEAMIKDLPDANSKAEEWDAWPLLVNTPSGIWDARTRTRQPHDPKLLLTQVTKGSGELGATSADLQAVLDNLAKSDPELPGLMQRVCGQGLLGMTADGFFMLIGPGGTGKSALSEAFMAALGGSVPWSYGATLMVDHLAAEKGSAGDKPMPALERCRNKRWVYIDELGRKQINAPLVKQLTGGGYVVTRGLNEGGSAWRPKAMFGGCGQDYPSMDGTDTGLQRRLILAEVGEASVFEGEPDQGIRDRLINTQEGHDALIAWALEGAFQVAAVQSGGMASLQVPEHIRESTRAHFVGMDPLGPWMDNRLDIEAPTQSSPDAPTIEELQINFRKWAADTGLITSRYQIKDICASMPDRLAAKGFKVSNRTSRIRKGLLTSDTDVTVRGYFVDGIRIGPTRTANRDYQF